MWVYCNYPKIFLKKNSVNVNLHCNKLINLHNYTLIDVGHFLYKNV